MKSIIVGLLCIIAAFVGTFLFLAQRPETSGSRQKAASVDSGSMFGTSPNLPSVGGHAKADAKPVQAPSISAGQSTMETPLAPARPTVAAPLTEAQRKRQQSMARIAGFESGKGWRELVERALLAPASLDLEERYLAARAMDICESQRGRTRNLEQERETFTRDLPKNEDQRAARLAAYGQMSHDPCSQLQGLDFSRDTANRMLRETSTEGDPKARVLLVEKEIRANPQVSRSSGLSQEQRGTLRDALTSQDPASIRRTGEILLATPTGWQNTFGPNGEKVEPWLVNAAWRLVACDYGMPCGPESTPVLSACAYNARCDAQTQEQLMQMYDMGSQRFAQVQRYRGIIAQAIVEGRWSWIGLGG
jgi:hypothetical protein